MIKIQNFKTLMPPEIFCEYLEINQSDVIKLNGASGIGKSIFLKALAGLRSSNFKTKKRIIYLSQASSNSNFLVSEYYNNVNSFKINKGKQFKNELINYLNLENLLYKKINDLSGGQKQIVALNLAFNLDPDLILIDEALSGIDREIIKKLINFIKLKETSIVYVSHQNTEFDSLKTHSIIINKSDNKIKVISS